MKGTILEYRLPDTSPELDPLLTKLIQLLEECSKNSGNCDNCIKLKRCIQVWDHLSEVQHHNKIKIQDYPGYQEMITFITNQKTLFD